MNNSDRYQGLGANEMAMRAMSAQNTVNERGVVRSASTSTLLAELKERKTRLRTEILGKQKELEELEAAMKDDTEKA